MSENLYALGRYSLVQLFQNTDRYLRDEELCTRP